MKQNIIKCKTVLLILILALGLIPVHISAQKVTKLFEKGQYKKAEQYCEKKTGEKQNTYYIELADAYFGKENYEKTAEYYEKAGIAKEGYLKIADDAFSKTNYKISGSYYEKAYDKKGLKKVGDMFTLNSNYDIALIYYAKAEIKENDSYDIIADDAFSKSKFDIAGIYFEKAGNNKGLIKIADEYFGKKDYEKAAEYYEKAEIAIEGYLKIANDAFLKENYDVASLYYEKAVNNEGLKKIANVYFVEKNYEKTAEYYEKAGIPKEGYLKIADDAYLKAEYNISSIYYEKAGDKNGLEKIINLKRKTKINISSIKARAYIYIAPADLSNSSIQHPIYPFHVNEIIAGDKYLKGLTPKIINLLPGEYQVALLTKENLSKVEKDIRKNSRYNVTQGCQTSKYLGSDEESIYIFLNSKLITYGKLYNISLKPFENKRLEINDLYDFK